MFEVELSGNGLTYVTKLLTNHHVKLSNYLEEVQAGRIKDCYISLEFELESKKENLVILERTYRLNEETTVSVKTEHFLLSGMLFQPTLTGIHEFV